MCFPQTSQLPNTGAHFLPNKSGAHVSGGSPAAAPMGGPFLQRQELGISPRPRRLGRESEEIRSSEFYWVCPFLRRPLEKSGLGPPVVPFYFCFFFLFFFFSRGRVPLLQ